MSSNNRTRPPSVDVEANRTLDDESVVDDSESQPETVPLLPTRPQKRRRRRKKAHGEGKPALLGIPREANIRSTNPDDYEAKYPADEFGEEAGPNARFWRVYLDEAELFDIEMTEGWRDTIDVLLVFAGLFSAVVTTFVAQTSQSLQPDYGQMSASLLTELVGLQRALMNGSSPVQVPSSSQNITTDFVADSLDRWVNGLWFTSLSLSLSTALFSVLIKQWIQNYVSTLTGDVRGRVRTRQFRYNGLEQWYIRGIIGLLPVMMHASLFIFFIGLVMFLKTLDHIITWVVFGLASISYLAYLASNVLPMKYPNCPFRTPISEYAYFLSSFVWNNVRRPFGSIPLHTLKQMESESMSSVSSELEKSSFLWLLQNSSSPTAMNVALQALSGMDDEIEANELFMAIDMTYDSTFSKIWRNEVSNFIERPPDDSDGFLRIERFSRAILRLSLPYLNESKDFLQPPKIFRDSDQEAAVVPSFAILRDATLGYANILRDRGLQTKMYHLVICAGALMCMLGRMFADRPRPSGNDWIHRNDIIRSLCSFAEIFDSNPPQSDKLQYYFKLFLQHLEVSLHEFYDPKRGRDEPTIQLLTEVISTDSVYLEIYPHLEAKKTIWCLLAIIEYFKPVNKEAIKGVGGTSPALESASPAVMLATKCLHMLIFPESEFYNLHNATFVDLNLNRKFEINDTHLVEAVCPRKWPERKEPGIDGYCAFTEADLPFPETKSLLSRYIDRSGRRTFLETPELNAKLHLALIRHLTGALSINLHPWDIGDWEWRWSWYHAVIDLLQTVGPDVDFEGRSTLLSLYATMEHKDILLRLPMDQREQWSRQLVAINRYLLHDMCHALKMIKIERKEKERGNMDDDTESLGDAWQESLREKNCQKMTREANGIIFCLQNAPQDVRSISICIEEDIMDRLLAIKIPISSWSQHTAIDQAAIQIIESAGAQFQEFDPIGQQHLVEYLLDADRFAAFLDSREGWKFRQALLAFCQQYISSQATVDPNTLVHKIETVFPNFGTNSGSSEMADKQKRFIDDLKKRLLV
ncbi:hypothetical protein FRC14_000329 [Serendipita sp. 396]|nr:hypothetical protein FRC14_000329 [Serendipita sp. 396]KAG8772104.1 hypothetical protein FRC15_002975 [Serendipita sp. 397]KAG8791806.1 hypothetical protein FRC16_000276 [Serendipita sp. 398]KAG8857270.1 hypothetical protein FRC20_000309 [Serendipita sp. 405]